MNRTLIVGVEDIGPIPENGEVVRCGPVGAVWQVRWHKLLSGDRIAINLEPYDPHDVPLDATIYELPMSERLAPAIPS